MGIANEILNLRESHESSVAALLGALDHFREAPASKRLSREYYVATAVELVLTNVAAHAAEALGEPAINHIPRRALSGRRKRPVDSGPCSRQRILFALR